MTLTLEEIGLPSGVLVWQALLMTAFSFAVGVLGGFVGLALGSIRLPPLLLLGIGVPTAAGTNIIVSTASAFTGAVRHLREGRTDLQMVLVMGLPSMAGAFVGGYNSRSVPESLLLLAVGLLLVWQGAEFVARARRIGSGISGAGAARSGMALGGWRTPLYGRALVAAGIGLAVGVLGGAVGLILGSLRLPALIRVLGIDPREAAGTNMLIGGVMGVTGWAGHVIQGQVDYPLVVLMGTSAMAGSYIGARFTGRVSVDRLVTTMGAVLVVIGFLLVWHAFAA